VKGALPEFNYVVNDFAELDPYYEHIQSFPDVDAPELSGLHANADITFRSKEVFSLLSTILDTMPKTSGGGTGRTKEDIVSESCAELLKNVPDSYRDDDSLDNVKRLGGMGIPLNIFLYQESQRLQFVIDKINWTLNTVIQAIRGEVVVTPLVVSVINAIFDNKVPDSWLYSPGGDEISWMILSLGNWFTGLLDRDAQLRQWLTGNRPSVYWLSGFFNPQGFLTAVQQEVTRAHRVGVSAKVAEDWALDQVQMVSEMSEAMTFDGIRSPKEEGVYISGLFLEGAGWNRLQCCLQESEPKKVTLPLPLLHVSAGPKTKRNNEYGPFGPYQCPLYKYPARTDKYLICHINLCTKEKRPSHWILRGTAMLSQES